MTKLPIPIAFVWDEGNIEKNWKKHQVHFKEAEEIFVNKPLIIIQDPKHSGAEQRFVAHGVTNLGRKITIFFTIRNNKLRVISARAQSRKERRLYEKET